MPLNRFAVVGVLVTLAVTSLESADPLAQKHVVVHKVRDLDDPRKAACVGKASPAIRADGFSYSATASTASIGFKLAAWR